MWTATPLDPPNVCASCQRGMGECGPYWNGPEVNTGLPGFEGPVRGKIAFCRECLFVVVNAPDSPFHGLLPIALVAEQTERGLRAELGKARMRLAKLEETGGLPTAVARAAVNAALATLAERGYVEPPAANPPAKRGRKAG